MKNIEIYWCRRDFRLTDNPALHSAVEKARENDSYFLPIFILEDYMLVASPKFQFGYPQRYFLSKAIPSFAENFQHFLLLKGKGAQSILNVVKKIKQDLQIEEVTVNVNEDVYTDFYKQIEKLKRKDISVVVYNDQLTVSKDTVSGTGSKYSIFTPFKKSVWKEFLSTNVLPSPKLDRLQYLPTSFLKEVPHQVPIQTEKILAQFSTEMSIQILDYETKHKHTINLKELSLPKMELSDWYYDEESAKKVFVKFLKDKLVKYKDLRDSLEIDATENGTSKMSLALAWGLVSARYLKQEIQSYFDNDFIDVNWFSKDDKNIGVIQYLSELIWREFYKYLLYHNPNLMDEEFQDRFRFKIDWVKEKEALSRFTAWIKGETGYPVVDAAMMQLAKTGWMHNRSRMIVASILTKNLGVDWRWGQEYFRAMLIDLDEASNNGGWQWGASVGADPKPIRIFNPYLQADNYDSKGLYQKKWLSKKENYDQYILTIKPIVEHKEARNDALKRYGLDSKTTPRDY